MSTDVEIELSTEIVRLRAENKRFVARIAELEERIAELYRAQKNGFLSLKSNDQTITGLCAENEALRKALREVTDVAEAYTCYDLTEIDRRLMQARAALGFKGEGRP